MAESFHRLKHSKPRLTFPKSFYLSLLSGKSPTFPFSEAPQKVRRAERFSRISLEAMPEIFSFPRGS
ncbi:hypothetical protein [Dapis sp. BLCC M172]|uniref:hypothetical protein n=1 Tax=Dapis sp. BLCC M172 TaxID=2975281 RepID=UPI003CF12444